MDRNSAMETNPKILCIGACHWDFTMQCAAEVIPGESNPVRSSRSPGGVAFNIARALTDLDCIVGLASRVGSDPGGRALVNYLTTSRIKAIDITEETNRHTAAYTAVVDPQGELVVGLADMEIYDRLDRRYWSSRVDKLAGWDAWCLDTNLPKSGLHYLSTLTNRPRLYAVVSSPSKGVRLKSSLGYINTLILNIAEASMLTGQSHCGIDGAEKAAQLLCAAGVDRTLVTQGAGGGAWADATSSGTMAAPPQPNQLIRVSGAGDALAAAVIAALEKRHSTAKALEVGIRASHLFMQSTDPITWTPISAQSDINHG
jgi:pseudouridine kinase